ncbi:hypothetical protein MMC07_000486 [Pseudocyphellaria aurata]|nr:hypothetical protein [Pseudocyphellaria aurata]
MARSLAKVQKKISKKKRKINSLHENSRDSQKLRRAGARSEKLERVSAARAKVNKQHLDRVAFFQEAAKVATGSMELDKIQILIQRFIARHDEEIEQLQSERRPGRPSSNREDLLRQKLATEDREYGAGFWLPDMEDDENLMLLRSWNGEWTSLSNFKYVRLTRAGVKSPSKFPPKGQS